MLEKLREELLEVDRQILEKVAARLEVVSKIGKCKREQQMALRSFSREKKVLSHALMRAAELGIPASLAKSVIDRLVEHALEIQERDWVQESQGGSGKTALVIGGCGKIGGWFVHFLSTQGFDVTVADPSVCEATKAKVSDWTTLELAFDVIVVATPLGKSADVLTALAEQAPRGLVFDVASLKGPVKDALNLLNRSGCRVTSVHPMFGPDTTMLSGRHVIFMNVGNAPAHQEARALFEPTMATCVDMTIDEHDELISYVLGLSHLLNISFFTALKNSGEQAERLRSMSSTSFNAQLKVAQKISLENPYLYYEIQRLNEYRHGPQRALLKSLNQIIAAIETGDEAAFVQIMEQGKAYLQSMV
ncbi:MAG: prephenate dehydrogenase/arogenate dehydrogenase family protein [Deltaproteobacteria bacterium]|nr:prephenate dehydrogenase/arogenate dehydrogenase family protein [Deltaproteobacteria bacterium]MBN2674632.1 prephenate dehydrogenase/arogenate dehydrogenase family protein [Deltaproteobacteria bacterium]